MGEEAIAYALHTSFDLILLDLCLPRVDGIRMIKELRSSPMAQLTPTIVVVGRKTNSCTLRRSLPVRISLSRNPASRTSCRQPSGHSSARTVGVKARGRAALNSAPEEYLPIYRLRAQARPPCRRSQKKPRTT